MLAVACLPRLVAAEADPSLASLEANWSKVVTWRATAVIEETSGVGNQARGSRLAFVLDRSVRCLRWKEESPDSVEVRAELIKHGAVHRRVGGTSPVVINIEDLRGAAGADNDPVAWLSAGLLQARTVLTRPGAPLVPDEWQPAGPDATTGGSLVLRRAGESSFVTLDVEQGTIQTARHARDQRSEDWTIRWERQSAAWLPAEIVVVRSSADGESTTRRIRFEESVVNQPVGRDEWSLEQIGARGGDIVRDTDRDVQYVHAGDAGAPMASAQPPATEFPMLTVVLNAFAWVAFIGSIALSQRRRTRRPG